MGILDEYVSNSLNYSYVKFIVLWDGQSVHTAEDSVDMKRYRVESINSFPPCPTAPSSLPRNRGYWLLVYIFLDIACAHISVLYVFLFVLPQMSAHCILCSAPASPAPRVLNHGSLHQSLKDLPHSLTAAEYSIKDEP